MRQVFQRFFSSFAKHGCPLRDNVFRENLCVIGTRHARIKMDFSVSSEHTGTD